MSKGKPSTLLLCVLCVQLLSQQYMLKALTIIIRILLSGFQNQVEQEKMEK